MMASSSRTPTDVDHHRAGRLVHRQLHPDGGRHRLLDCVGPPSTSVIGRLFDRPPLHAGDAGRDTNDDAGPGPAALVNLLNEIAQHLLGDVEVGDDAVPQRSNRLDVGGGAADHALGLHPHGQRPVGLGVDGYHRGLIEDDALTAHIHQRVGGAQVNGHVPASKRKQRVSHGSLTCQRAASVPEACFSRYLDFAASSMLDLTEAVG